MANGNQKVLGDLTVTEKVTVGTTIEISGNIVGRVGFGATPPGTTAVLIQHPSTLGLTGASQQALGVFNEFNATVATAAVRGVYVWNTLTGANSVSEVMGLYIIDPSLSGGATINTQYGIRITGLSSATTNWAIYTDAGKNHLGDSLHLVGALGLGSGLSGRHGVYVDYPSTIFTTAGNNRMVGVHGTFSASSASSSARVIDAESSLDGAAAVPDYYGVKIGDVTLSGGASITRQYGLNIASQTQGTDKYAIYTNLGRNRFGDRIAQGTEFAPAHVNLEGATSIPSGVTQRSLRLASFFNPTVATNRVDCLEIDATLSGSGATDFRAVVIYIPSAGNGTALGGASINNAYGIVLNDVSAGTVSNTALSTGLGKVLFGDDVKVSKRVAIGGTTPVSSVALYLYDDNTPSLTGTTQRSASIITTFNAGVATTINGININLNSVGTGSPTNIIMMNILDIDVQSGTLTPTNSYGINIGTIDSATNNWAIKTALGLVDFGDRVLTSASTTSRAGLNIPSGTAPTSPVSGDIWYDGTNLLFRNGATTQTITWT